MKTATAFHLITFCFCVGFQCLKGQIVTENWYKIKNEEYHGYLHYRVTENKNEIFTELEFKLKVEETVLYVNAVIISVNDPFLTVKKFNITGTTDDMPDPDTYVLAGYVDSSEFESIWHIEKYNREITTIKPTLVDWNLYHVLTKLDYSTKGKIVEFNIMEISELNYKKNHYLTYQSDEKIMVKGRLTPVKKITHQGEGIGESSFYLDSNNMLVKISLDNYKNYELCDQKDINFKLYE